MTYGVFKRGFFGAINRVFAINARVALGAIVVDQQQVKAQVTIDGVMQLQQVIALKALVKALHQQLRAVTVDGQAASTFLAAVEQAIAISALGMQPGQQVLTVIEGGAQRLIQGRHAMRLGG